MAHVRIGVALLVVAACGSDGPGAKDPRTAERAPIDRFSDAAGTRFVRSADSALPAANAPIDYDRAPFLVLALGPDGRRISQYEFDVMPRAPAPIYVFFEEGASRPVAQQKNVVTVIPGDPGYSDLWRVVRVDVPEGYVANTVTSYDEIVEAGYPQTPMGMLVNCPVVPEGSIARVRLAADDYTELTQGWYGGRIIQYFHFGEAPLAVAGDDVPSAPAWVAYAINPDQPGGGPPSGYAVEAGSMQTHNVAGVMPGEAMYSPLWSVNVYDNAAFAAVRDLPTVTSAPQLARDVALVNAPIIAID